MSSKLEVKYYNTFWLKQVTTPVLYNDLKGVDDGNGRPAYCKVFPGFPYNRESDNTLEDGVIKLPNWPVSGISYVPSSFYSNVSTSPSGQYSQYTGSKWIIEESRIRGGFNNNQVDLGVRAYLKEDSNQVKNRKNALIYSGIFNSRTNVNNTNVFSIGEDITKAVDPHNGSVQLIYAMDNNLTIFQENKVSTALIDKDAIYSAEGEPMSTKSDVVIGQVTPYTGDYGISRNPESFASFGFRRYFVDKDRNAVLRLSRDGITEISNYGMKDYFRDELAKISEDIIIRSEPFQLNYNATTGLIEQGPNNLSGALQPFAYKPWVSLFSRSIGNTISGINIGSEVELNLNFDPSNPGSGWNRTSLYVVGLGKFNSTNIFYLNKNFLNVNGLNLNPYVRFSHREKESIQGGYDNHKGNYIVSLQRKSGSKTLDETSDYYNTLTFDETVQGWTTFYTYRPDFIFSLKNKYYTIKNDSIYVHYVDPSESDHNNFYGVSNSSSVTFNFNGNPSISKNFKTISYEGSDGWQVESFTSDATDNAGIESRDTINTVKSYQEGVYTENGIPYRVGFNRKDNKYVANLVNNSAASSEEVNFGSSITGIKGFFATVKISTDATTNAGGVKELFAVSTEFVVPSR